MKTSVCKTIRFLKADSNLRELFLLLLVEVAILVAGFWSVISIHATVNGEDGQFYNQVWSAVIVLVIWGIHLSLLRKYVKRSFYASSSEGSWPVRGDDEDPGKATGIKPRSKKIDFQTPTPNAEHLREERIDQNAKRLKKIQLLLFIPCLLYLLLPLGLSKMYYQTYAFEARGGLIVITTIYFLIIALYPVFFRRKHSAEGKRFESTIPQIEIPKRLLKGLLNPNSFYAIGLFFALVIFLEFIIGISKGRAVVTNGLWVAVAIHVSIIVYLLVYPRLKPYAGPNTRLLILRVFGSSESAAFTLDRLIRYWKLFGTHMTIDDPYYAEYRYSFEDYRTIWIGVAVLFLGFDWYLAMGYPTAVIVYDWYNLLIRRPARDPEQIQRRIRRTLSRPRLSSLYFKDLRMIAYMNTWKIALAAFVKNTDVILMDLRGYENNRAGCKFEVNYILDTFPIDKIIFLRDKQTDSAAIEKIINTSWKKLEEGSPNEHLTDPVYRIYVVHDQKGRDVQALLNTLLTAAAIPGGSGTAPVVMPV